MARTKRGFRCAAGLFALIRTGIWRVILELARLNEAMAHEPSNPDGPPPAKAHAVAELIQSARQGDASARDKLLASYREYLRLLARMNISPRLGARIDDSDVAQEALLKAHRGFAQFRGSTEAELAAWLRRILSHTLSDLARHHIKNLARALGRERSLDRAVDASSAGLMGLLAASQDTPSTPAQHRELSVVIAGALAQLDPDHREVLELRSLQEKDWEEIAERMGRSTDAVRMLWQRALKRIQPLLDGKA